MTQEGSLVYKDANTCFLQPWTNPLSVIMEVEIGSRPIHAQWGEALWHFVTLVYICIPFIPSLVRTLGLSMPRTRKHNHGDSPALTNLIDITQPTDKLTR